MSAEHNVEDEGHTIGICIINGYCGPCETCPDRDNPRMLCNMDD